MLLLAAPLLAQQAGSRVAPQVSLATTPLVTALMLPELIEIMRDEGLEHADELAQEMFPDAGRTRWLDMVERIYDPARMQDIVVQQFDLAMQGVDIPRLEAFYGTDQGKRIVALELSARRALLDEAVVDLSRQTWEHARDTNDPSQAILGRFIEANDLIEINVMGALNANFAFYLGLSSGGAFDASMTEDQMLREVWSQEEAIRTETTQWVYSYLTLAFQPLSAVDLEAYIALSNSTQGRALNGGLFAAFDALFVTLSGDLGRAAAQFMGGEDI
ncbi:MAG: hypothetical protein ACJA1F_002906 [Paracoccaceae bacterium]|jgi:hypothetical protein